MKDSLHIKLYSFGFQKSGIPQDTTGNKGGYVFDCRALPNPFHIPELKELTGTDAALIEYMQSIPDIQKFLDLIYNLVEYQANRYIEKEYTDLMLSFGCTGGRHRSVYCAEQITQRLAENGFTVQLTHVDKP